MKRILKSLNIFEQCRSYDVGLFSCPQFLFVIMGVVIIITILVTYFVGKAYADVEIIALIILSITAFLLIVSFTITRAFEKVVEARLSERAKARELLSLKDHFVFIVAHELRVPATAIKWGLESLETRRPAFFKTEKNTFSIIKNNNERLLLLVRDLLQVARIEGKTIRVALKPVSIYKAFKEAVVELKKEAAERHISIVNNLPKNLSLVQGDELRIKEILVNLLSNAVKYGRERGTVSVSAENKKGFVEIHVTDNGLGIDKEEQKHIFEKFWRSPRIQEIEGTGLGLFIVKQLVGLMGGKIWFMTIPEKGSTFSFSFPTAP